ncbi:alpha/beta hydrolase [Streptomyces sp. NPDC001928]|uniref:alpha/beta fold hydrolase n=1 Tax=Streptomyces sp. NPDC001928 TaxID=3154404 RepID=UPI0033257563
MSAKRIDVVLVHGAWADGSSWRKVIGPLRDDGINVVAAPLPLTSLADDVAALDRVLERLEGPVVLVGHAYGGVVIASTRAAKVASLVYVAALAPDEGESAGDAFHRGEPHPKRPQLEPDSHGLVWLPEEDFTNAFAQNASYEEQAVLAAVQRPIAVACIGAPVERPLWKDRPSWSLVAEKDRMIAPDTQRFMAERMGARARTRPVDHTPQVTAPGEVVDIVLDAVRDVAAPQQQPVSNRPEGEAS